MKNTLLFLLLFLSFRAFSQDGVLVFTIRGSNVTPVFIPASAMTGNSFSVGAEGKLSIVMKNPGSQAFRLAIKTSANDRVNYTQEDFYMHDTLKTQAGLVLLQGSRRAELKNTTTTFSISVGGRRTVDFKYKIMTQPAGARTQETPALRGGTGPEPVGAFKPGLLYYDALKLAAPSISEEDFLKIVHYYFGATNDVNHVTTKEAAKTMIEAGDNVFMKGYDYTKIASDPTVTAFGGFNFGASIVSGVSSAGALDVTSIADGLAKFIVQRTKQELDIAFFSRFRLLLENPEFKDMQTVFPSTYNAMLIIGDQIYNYQVYLQSLREAFEKDLSSLSAHLPGIIENHPVFFERYPELAASLKSGCYIADAVKDKKHPGDVLRDYPLSDLDGLGQNYKAAIQTLQLVSASLKDSVTATGAPYWVSVSQLRTLVTDTAAFRLYLALLHEQAKKEAVIFVVRNSSTGAPQQVRLAELLRTVAPNLKAAQTYFVRFAEKADKLDRLISSYQKAASDSMSVEQYAAYFDASLNMLEYAAAVGSLVPAKWVKDNPQMVLFTHLSDTLKPYFTVARSASDLVLDINRRNYGAAVLDAVTMYKLVFNDTSATEIARYAAAVAALQNMKGVKFRDIEWPLILSIRNGSSAEYIRSQPWPDAAKTAATTVVKYYKEYNVLSNGTSAKLRVIPANGAFDYLFKYGTFMASMVEAKTSDEVEEAIEAFALPPGSSRIKRESPFNVSLNAYSGLFAGYERIQGFSGDNKVAVNSYGITAPVGVAISMGQRFFWLGSEKRRHWSYSAFISVIDVGAIAAFRFQNDTAAQVPKIQLKNIISPGLFVSVGIPKCPLSVNLGAQIGPNLRKVGVSDNTLSDNLYVRYSVSLCVDIPVLNFYTRSNN